jgi:hypothetical protein
MSVSARSMRMASAVVVAAVVLAVGVVWDQLDPGPLRRIVVSSSVSRGSGVWQIEINDGNRYSYAHDAVEERGRIPFAPFARRLASVLELRLLPSSARNGTPGLAYWVEGRRRTVAPFLLGDSGDHGELRAFAKTLHETIVRDVGRRNAPVVDALSSLQDLRSVQIVSNGCFGSCGAYSITLRSDRSGTLTWSDGREIQHRATDVDWSHVRSLLREAHVERLSRKYPSTAVDTQSASLRFTFPRLDYLVEAPDSSNWPLEFSEAFRAMRRLSAVATWSPALPADQAERLAR